MNTPRDCRVCGHLLRPNALPISEATGTRAHAGRGLCRKCYDAARYAGTLIDHERRYRPREEVLEEWEHVGGRCVTCPEAARRLNMPAVTLQAVLNRARRDGQIERPRPWRELRSA